MQKHPFLLFLLLSFCILSQAQQSLNMQLYSNWDDNSLPNRSGIYYNDIWGYSHNGREYAILGTVVGTIFLEVTNPYNPREVTRINGGYPLCLWRDFKTYGHYAYGVADETDPSTPSGLQIFDLADLPNRVTKVYDSNIFFETAHNIFIDENAGRLYVVGSDTRRNGIIVLDISSNPASPTLLASINLPGGYIHDVFVRNDTAYCSHGWNGLYAYDMQVPTLPITLMAFTNYSNQGYNHSSWLTDDGQHLIFADESHNRYLKVLDISDMNNPAVVGTIKSAMLAPTASNSIAHNPFVKGDSVYISYYHEGVQIYNISDPTQPVNVSYYDTEPNNSNYSGYDGCWGVYPYLPSGNIIASDITRGLHVMKSQPSILALGNLSLQATPGPRAVELRWQDSEYSDFVGFEIERAAPGEAFVGIGQLPMDRPGASYMLRDEAPLIGEASYRLVAIDAAGNRQFSQEVLLSFQYRENSLEAFPVPARKAEGISLRFHRREAGLAHLSLLSASGQVLLRQPLQLQAGSSLHQLEMGEYAAGMYFLLIVDEQGQWVERIEMR